MANVQIDNGEFTRIANELLENLAKTKLNGTQYAVVLTIWRFTYGFNRTSHEFSLTFLEEATGINKMQIRRELVKLIDRNIILVKEKSFHNRPQILQFNKDYDQWQEYTKTLTVSENANPGVSELANSGVSENANQERKIKDNIKDKQKEEEVPVEINLYKAFEKEFARPLSPMEFEQIGKWEQEHPKIIVFEALKQAVLLGKYNFKYMDIMLLDWHKNNLRTVREVQEHQERFKVSQGKRQNKKPPNNRGPSEDNPDFYD